MKKTKNELYNLWMDISPLIGWYRLLKIINHFTEQYDEEDFSYLEKLDTDFLKIEKEAKKDYYIERARYKEEMFKTQKKMKEKHKEWIKQRRTKFLIGEIKKLEEIMALSHEIYFDQQQRNIPFWLRKTILLINNPEKLTKLYGKLNNELYFLQNKKELNENQLTHEEIIHARGYPFTKLIEVNRVGFAKCPFHNEEKPSFWIKNNFAHCFGCGKSVDTIQFIIETENISFVQAVRFLNSL